MNYNNLSAKLMCDNAKNSGTFLKDLKYALKVAKRINKKP